VLACACVLGVPPIVIGTPVAHVPVEHAQTAAVEHSAAAEDGVQPAAEARAGSRALSVATGRAVARGDVYFTYVPGRAELPWLSGLGGGQQLDGRTCDVAAEPTLILRQRHALRLADELRANPHTAPATEANPRSPLSHMVYCPPGSTRSDQSGSQQHGCRVEPIEPLHAFGRHPFAEVGCKLHERSPPALEAEEDIFNIDFLILASRCADSQGAKFKDRAGYNNPAYRSAAAFKTVSGRSNGGGSGGGGVGHGGWEQASGVLAGLAPSLFGAANERALLEQQQPVQVHTGKNYFFDAGCSVYARPTSSRASKSMMGAQDGKGKLGGSALGPSMPLFAKLYKERCIDFDGIWGWEARPFQAEKWWDKVPTEVRHKLHFYNVPISGAGGAADVLLTIGQVARPEDFVVLKLDIDTFEVERQVVEELRTNARGTNASLLVDEFFFEYHFATPNEPTLHTYWPKRTRGGTVDDALSLMHELRAKGIRAHFWI